MSKSRRAMRRTILSTLFDLLVEDYDIGLSKESFVDGKLSAHELDAILSFKSDPRVVELRSAFDRLEAGTYGVCISCKGEIRQEVLDVDPARRVCANCELQYSHTTMTTYATV